MENFKSIPGGICAPAGFSAAGVHCGIRHNHSKLFCSCNDIRI